jgi:hypothetical protein
MVVIMVFPPVFNGCAIAADAHRERRRMRKAGMPFTGACRRTNSQGRLRPVTRLRVTGAMASVEFGGFRDFRDGVKVASLRLPMDVAARGKAACQRKASAESRQKLGAPWCDGGISHATGAHA